VCHHSGGHALVWKDQQQGGHYDQSSANPQ